MYVFSLIGSGEFPVDQKNDLVIMSVSAQAMRKKRNPG